MSDYYNALSQKRGDSTELQECIRKVVENLKKNETSINRPGMLLGKIQSGKTRAFIGVIAQAFDNSYDISVVLTKGTKVLARQTYERILTDFSELVEDDKLQVYDIMNLPQNLTTYVLRQKLIFVAKKQKHNLDRIIECIEKTYPNLKNKKILIIDDEADFASIGFKKSKEDKNEIEVKKIAGLINELRTKAERTDFLQVTATPYSLYLQPEDFEIEGKIFKPIRPAFTVLLPTFNGYVGGNYYFSEEDYEDTIDDYIYQEIQSNELDIIKRGDRRVFRIEEALTSNKIRALRKSIVNFVVGSTIRRIQQSTIGVRPLKYSFIVHTEISKKTHTWQEEIVTEIKKQLIELADNNVNFLNDMVKKSFEELNQSLRLLNLEIPRLEKVQNEVCSSLQNGFIMITKVNSEKQVEELLNSRGELKLTNPFNIFIGGQILDRGITIENLIGFYYGRKPNKFQQDTVLQHSRMYGNRKLEDLGVTRFYTTSEIYQAMKKIHEFDSALREAFEKGGHEAGIVFIRKDENDKIIPCSPNKILISTITSLKPHKRMLPIGFQTKRKTKIKKAIKRLDEFIFNSIDTAGVGKIDLKDALMIIDAIDSTLIFEFGYGWNGTNLKAFKAGLEYLSLNTPIDGSHDRGKVWVIVRKNRNIKRIDSQGLFENAPDTPKGERGETKIARELAQNIPALILLRENGDEKINGWMGSPFWWPVLIAPKSTPTVIYASDTVDYN